MRWRRLTFDQRLALVRFAEGSNYNRTAIEFGVDGETVKKWVTRFREHGEEGLRDRVQERQPVVTTTGTPRHLIGAAALVTIDATVSVREAREAITGGQVGIAAHRLQEADRSLLTLQGVLRRMEGSR